MRVPRSGTTRREPPRLAAFSFADHFPRVAPSGRDRGARIVPHRDEYLAQPRVLLRVHLLGELAERRAAQGVEESQDRALLHEQPDLAEDHGGPTAVTAKTDAKERPFAGEGPAQRRPDQPRRGQWKVPLR